MKRTVRKDIRWTQYEIDTIEEVLEEGEDFSEFIRTAALEKVNQREHELSNNKKSE